MSVQPYLHNFNNLLEHVMKSENNFQHVPVLYYKDIIWDLWNWWHVWFVYNELGVNSKK